jgi:hypothetical protein
MSAKGDYLVAWCDGRIIGCGAIEPPAEQTSEIVLS